MARRARKTIPYSQPQTPRPEIVLPPLTAPPANLEPLFMGFVLLLAVGFFVFRRPWVVTAVHELSPDRAAFVTINAATLSGFATQPLGVNDYTLTGQITALALTIGGMCFAMIAGGMLVRRIARLPYSDRTIIFTTIGAILASAILGIAALSSRAISAFGGAFDGISALGNSGLFLGTSPESNYWAVHAVLLPLALLGGWSVPLMIELFDAIQGKKSLSRHARITIAMTCGVYVIGGILLFAAHGNPQSQVDRFAADSAAAAINTRTAGFAFTSIRDIGRVGQWLIIALMIIGGASGGAAGGLKVSTLFVLTRGVRRILRGEMVEKIFGIACIWLLAYFVMVIAIYLALLVAEPQMPADRLLFLSVSAVSNVGLAHDPVSITGAGLFILSVAMLIGRIAPLLVLWWIVRSAPEADVAIG